MFVCDGLDSQFDEIDFYKHHILKVFVCYAFFYAEVYSTDLQIVCCKHHIDKVYRRCVFVYAFSGYRLGQIVSGKHCTDKVSLQCVPFCGALPTLWRKIFYYKHHIRKV